MKQHFSAAKKKTELSKFLSLVLRHSPEKINLTLDSQGWARTDDLLTKLNDEGFKISFIDLKMIVEENKKKRFSFSDKSLKIRANQGHSINIDLKLTPKMPPNILYHGTAIGNIDNIKIQGILKGSRQFVHLSDDYQSAWQIGTRHGKSIVLKIDTSNMYLKGFPFFLSDNNIWLIDSVPPDFITVLPENSH